MTDSRARERTFTAAECARRTGLTIKALRLYEARGLLRPRRTAKGWRVYGHADLMRIAQIAALRTLGLALSEVAMVMGEREPTLARMLDLQYAELLRRRAAIDQSLAGLSRLKRMAADGKDLSIDDISTAVREMQTAVVDPDVLVWRRHDQMRPRIAIEADRASMAQCCGHYVFDGGLLIEVFLRDDALMAQVWGQPALQLHPEAPDSYFYTEVPAQLSFQRDAAGRVISLRLHQHGLEQAAARIDRGEAERRAESHRRRVESGVPHPNSRALVETLLDRQAAGSPSLGLMTPALAAIVSEQSDRIAADLRELGQRKGLRFLAVTAQGWDSYRATFETGELDVSILLDETGRMSGAFIDAPRSEGFWERQRRGRPPGS